MRVRKSVAVIKVDGPTVKYKLGEGGGGQSVGAQQAVGWVDHGNLVDKVRKDSLSDLLHAFAFSQNMFNILIGGLAYSAVWIIGVPVCSPPLIGEVISSEELQVSSEFWYVSCG